MRGVHRNIADSREPGWIMHFIARTTVEWVSCLGLTAAVLTAAPAAWAQATKPATPAAPPAAKPPAAAPAAKPAAAPAAAAPAPSGPDVAAGQAPDSPWVKVCGNDPGNKQTCVVRMELRGDNGVFISSVSLQKVPDGDKYGFGILMPVGVFLPPGVGITVDTKKSGTAPYTICLPNPPVCVAELLVDNAFITSLKKGAKVTLTASNAQRKEINIDMPLTGFGKVFDGPGMDVAQAMAKQQELTDALQKKADQARQKLIDQQKAGAAAAPAPTAAK